MKPARLYKYRSLATAADLERLYASLHRGEFFASSATAFNDPFDCSPRLEFHGSDQELAQTFLLAHAGEGDAATLAERAVEHVRLFRLGDSDVQGEVADAARAFALHLTSQWGVFSAAARWDSELMWGHYASAHTGVCIELDTDQLPADLALHPVQYSIDRPGVNFMKERPQRDDQDAIIKRFLLTKSKAWEYEEEWRILRPANVGKFAVPEGCVSSITLGARTPQYLSDILIASIRHARPGMPIHRAMISTERFEIERRRLY